MLFGWNDPGFNRSLSKVIEACEMQSVCKLGHIWSKRATSITDDLFPTKINCVKRSPHVNEIQGRSKLKLMLCEITVIDVCRLSWERWWFNSWITSPMRRWSLRNSVLAFNVKCFKFGNISLMYGMCFQMLLCSVLRGYIPFPVLCKACDLAKNKVPLLGSMLRSPCVHTCLHMYIYIYIYMYVYQFLIHFLSI